MKEAGKHYKIIGMCWMQGEKDTRKELSATNYETNLTSLIRAYRKDLNLPTLPFVAAQVNCPLRGKKDYPRGAGDVREAIKRVSETVPHTAIIPTSMNPSWSDFPKHDDDVHYNSEGQKRLGTAFAKALIDLTQ